MTISYRIQQQLVEMEEFDARDNAKGFTCTSSSEEEDGTPSSPRSSPRSFKKRENIWTRQEHEKFLEALDLFPAGPWRKIAEYVGNKTPRQAMTHAQKFRQKMQRRKKRYNRLRAQQEALRSAIHQINCPEPGPLLPLKLDSSPTALEGCVTPCHQVSIATITTPTAAQLHTSPEQFNCTFTFSPSHRSSTSSSVLVPVKRELVMEDQSKVVDLDLEKDCIADILTHVAVAHAAWDNCQAECATPWQLSVSATIDEVTCAKPSWSTWPGQRDLDQVQDQGMVLECLTLLTDSAASTPLSMH